MPNNYHSISEEKTATNQRKFNSEDAIYCIQKSTEVGAQTGAVVGGILTAGFFCFKFMASGTPLPTNPIDPCDGTPGAIMLGVAALPGAAVGGLGGAATGAVAGASCAPIVGYHGVPKFFDDRKNSRPQEENELQVSAAAPPQASMS